MTAIEHRTGWNHLILVPSDFTWRDDETLLVHQGAVWLRPEGDQGRVLGFSTLCTETMTPRWKEKPSMADDIVTCFGCLGASEQ